MVTYSATKGVRLCNGGQKVSSLSAAGKTGQLHVKNEIITFPDTTYKKNSKLIKNLNVRLRIL